jgi:hypothetical protein
MYRGVVKGARDGERAKPLCAACVDLSHGTLHASPEMLHLKPPTVLSIPRQVSWRCRSVDCASDAVRVGLTNLALNFFLVAASLRLSGRRASWLRFLVSQARRNMVMQLFNNDCASCALICSPVVGSWQRCSVALRCVSLRAGFLGVSWKASTNRVVRLAQLLLSSPWACHDAPDYSLISPVRYNLYTPSLAQCIPRRLQWTTVPTQCRFRTPTCAIKTFAVSNHRGANYGARLNIVHLHCCIKSPAYFTLFLSYFADQQPSVTSSRRCSNYTTIKLVRQRTHPTPSAASVPVTKPHTNQEPQRRRACHHGLVYPLQCRQHIESTEWREAPATADLLLPDEPAGATDMGHYRK